MAETRDLDENTLIDLDAKGDLVSITLEHASRRTNITTFSYQQINTPVSALSKELALN